MLAVGGKVLLLDTFFSGIGYTAALYLGLIDGSGPAPVFNAGDSMASHPGWDELTCYAANTRPPVTFDPAAAASKKGVASLFVYTAPCTYAGFFLSTSPTKGGGDGVLISAGLSVVSPFDRYAGDSTTGNFTYALG